LAPQLATVASNCRLIRDTAGNVRLTLGDLAAHRRPAALALSIASTSLLIAGCGGSTKEQDKYEQAGTYPVRVVSASFPKDQKLAKDSSMEIVVENAGDTRIPDINVTVKCAGKGLGGSFMTVTGESDVADPERPQFIVNKIPTATERIAPPLDPAPLERSSALVDTYPLGPLAEQRRATFRWDVTAVKAGPYKLCWRVNAGLYGKAKAVASSDSELPISGEFEGEVSNKAPKARIAEDGRTVIRDEDQ
jgi:hypothetical protein